MCEEHELVETIQLLTNLNKYKKEVGELQSGLKSQLKIIITNLQVHVAKWKKKTWCATMVESTLQWPKNVITNLPRLHNRQLDIDFEDEM